MRSGNPFRRHKPNARSISRRVPVSAGHQAAKMYLSRIFVSIWTGAPVRQAFQPDPGANPTIESPEQPDPHLVPASPA
jgi:hypothetical protein